MARTVIPLPPGAHAYTGRADGIYTTVNGGEIITSLPSLLTECLHLHTGNICQYAILWFIIIILQLSTVIVPIRFAVCGTSAAAHGVRIYFQFMTRTYRA